MRVHVPRLEISRWTNIRVDEFEDLATRDRFGIHEIVAEPDAADVILFLQCHMVDWRLLKIMRHPTAARHWPKVMVYDERDRPWRSFPGVYVSSPASSFNPVPQRAWSYLRVRTARSDASDPDLLFSFMGSATAPCRLPILALRHQDAVVEATKDFMVWSPDEYELENQRFRYQEILARSRFVLCPRGRGTSTFRLYETLAAGRVPVIVSDDWVPPEGPAWDLFTVRVPEAEVQSLVTILEERDKDWDAMRNAAEVAHRDFFAEDVTFHRVTELLADLRANGATPSSPGSLKVRGIIAAAREKRRPPHAPTL
jgi:hypothetical protein